MTFNVDLHVHTDASLDGLHSLAQQASMARAVAMDAIAVTDHNLCTPVPQFLNGVLLIPGCEVSTTDRKSTRLNPDTPENRGGGRRG